MTKAIDEQPKRKSNRRGQGEGSIYQRDRDGHWTASITVGYFSDQKRIRKTIYGKTKKEVAAKLTRLSNQKLDRALSGAESQRLSEYLTN